MPLMSAGTIGIPHALGTSFDHGAFEPKTCRVFIAHTARDCVEVVDADTNQQRSLSQCFTPTPAGQRSQSHFPCLE